jgi:hypothetical protein
VGISPRTSLAGGVLEGGVPPREKRVGSRQLQLSAAATAVRAWCWCVGVWDAGTAEWVASASHTSGASVRAASGRARRRSLTYGSGGCAQRERGVSRQLGKRAGRRGGVSPGKLLCGPTAPYRPARFGYAYGSGTLGGRARHIAGHAATARPRSSTAPPAVPTATPCSACPSHKRIASSSTQADRLPALPLPRIR